MGACGGYPRSRGRAAPARTRSRDLGAEPPELADSEPCDIEPLLRKLGVAVQELGLTAKSIDAVCAWGPKHGPVVFINSEGPHASGHRGRRATLAHELCHLLVDRSRTLPLGEVKGGRAPREVEARANAFAAELLVPTVVAGQEMANVTGAPEAELERLCRKYGASRAVTAWQALNSGIPLPRSVHR